MLQKLVRSVLIIAAFLVISPTIVSQITGCLPPEDQSTPSPSPEPPGTESPLAYVPDGAFWMGANDEAPYGDHYPAHIVTLSTYWIERHEVTNARFAAYLNIHGLELPESPAIYLSQSRIELDPDTLTYRPVAGYEQHPVTGVTWYGAADFCASVGGVLPTEAQWEKSARGGCDPDCLTAPPGPRFPWGDTLPTCDVANFYDAYGSGDRCVDDTVPAGSYAPSDRSPFGVSDLAGNAYEWVADWYDSDYYEHSALTDPTGPTLGTYKVIRGGSFVHTDTYLKTYKRYIVTPDSAARTLGFRCAYTAESVSELADRLKRK